MDYTVVPGSVVAGLDKACSMSGFGSDDRFRMLSEMGKRKGDNGEYRLSAEESISYFCWHMLGLRPYAWQHWFFEEVLKDERDVLACTPRQVGKSFASAVAALHAAIFNLYPVRSKGGKTIIGIVSRSEKQSKQLIKNVRELMFMGDVHLEEAYGGFYKGFFKSRLSSKQVDTNNKSQLTFREPELNSKGEWVATGRVTGEIISIPATDGARGFTFSKLFMDEAAFFEDPEFYGTIAEPTLRATGGHSVVTTTPNGQKGWFFRTFDPFDERYGLKNPHPAFRLWLNWEHIENKLERKSVLDKKWKAEREGTIKLFQQEYEAKFTVDARAFFDVEKVDSLFNANLSRLEGSVKPTDLGIDVGTHKSSQTVITISQLGEDGVIRRVWDYAYKPGNDLTLVGDVLELIPRFNVQRVIIDDCAAASAFIQGFRKAGVLLKLMSFKTFKTSKYVQFKSKLYQGLVESYKDKDLSVEMKALEEVDGARSTRIVKADGTSDDRIDSFVISVFFMVEDKRGVRTWDWDEVD